ncbi:MAG: transcriptional regulator [Chloroflexi bacterium]|nr:transcriptional regulator [Chloroflexota bacterium]
MNTPTAPLISVDEARRLLGGRGRGRIYELLKEGLLESVTDGSRRFIVTDSLYAFIDSLKVASERREFKRNV